MQHFGRQRVDRRQLDPAGDAGRGQRIPATAGARSKTWSRRWIASSNHRFGNGDSKVRGSQRDRRGGRHRRRRHDQPGGQLGLRRWPPIRRTPSRWSIIDLCLGDADVFLDTIPDYTLVDVAQNVTRLDFTLLKRSLTKHASGLYLLPRPVQLEDAALITPDDLRRVIGLLKATFTHLIIDLSKSYSAIGHGGAGNGQPCLAGHAARSAMSAECRAADDVVRPDERP